VATRLQLTALDIQDGTRIREAVEAAYREIAKKHGPTLVVRKIWREARQVEIELREFLARMGIADADEEAQAICDSVVEDLIGLAVR
jgi:hypothetical protein